MCIVILSVAMHVVMRNPHCAEIYQFEQISLFLSIGFGFFFLILLLLIDNQDVLWIDVIVEAALCLQCEHEFKQSGEQSDEQIWFEHIAWVGCLLSIDESSERNESWSEVDGVWIAVWVLVSENCEVVEFRAEFRLDDWVDEFLLFELSENK